MSSIMWEQQGVKRRRELRLLGLNKQKKINKAEKINFGTKTMGKCFHTNAVEPDPHASAGRGMYAALMATMGATDFGYGGMLAVDKVFSAEQLLIDIEIIRYLEHFMKGFEFSEETLAPVRI